ncbi:cysteine desulfurase family protein [Paenisporosarcina cavernae]|uniref:cysteine desulfurase n=1 Tax=Paenisporosarcina cavernae TaxID=2320858 RepID=A0A385YW06_9BACL|nr:cysteine desulfurase family protein [Paenisporosarcina cavernae]AYC29713.1 cysteine desulfurase [Paenisporosarcina cavernae]
MKTYYLDHAATTPLHPSVLEVMSNSTHIVGNPSSIHSFGREARKHIDDARSTIAKSIQADLNEIIFTSGGTEADNFAILGIARAMKDQGKHVITSEIEHHAVLHAFHQLEKEGFEVTYLPVTSEGLISLNDVKHALREDTILLSIMYGNNEVGTIQPIKEIGSLVKDLPLYFHTDAVQAYGMIDMDVRDLGVDLLSISSHKINGPKGIGALYAKKNSPLQSLTYGGSQERKRRAGTENVQAIIGFAEAVKILEKEREIKTKRFLHFKELLLSTWRKENVRFSVNGSKEFCLPHILNVSFDGTDVETLLINFDMEGIAVSSGSACTAGAVEPSHVLVAMHSENSPKLQNSIRFSFGENLTEEDIVDVAKMTSQIIHRLVK